MSVDDLLQQGNLCLEKGELDKAISCYERITNQDPDNVDAHFNLGIACMRKIEADIEKDELFESHTDEQGWGLRAIGEFETVLELDSDCKEAKENIEGIQKILDMEV